MKRTRLVVAGLIVGAILVGGIGLYIGSLPPIQRGRSGSRLSRLLFPIRRFWQEQFPPLVNCNLEITGTTGTPVVVGCRIDGSRSGIFRGVIPTNYVIQARRGVYLAIKNVGTTNAALGFNINSPRGGGASSSFIFPPCYGFSGESRWGPMSSSVGGSGNLNPNDWPVTLPPGMTTSEAQSHDFGKDLIRLRLKDVEAQLAHDPNNQRLLAAAGSYYLQLRDRAGAEAMYERFFATDCKDPMFLNIVVYEYADNGGTNLDRACELAAKAQQLAQKSDPYQLPDIDDTVAWILLKRGYYGEALNILASVKTRFTPEIPVFHLGAAYYMLMDEELARKAFLQVLDYQKAAQNRLPRSHNPQVWESKETRGAREYLAVLDTKVDPPKRVVAAELKARLAQMPDDPVALNRLGELYSSPAAPKPRPPNDPLVLKALGVRAYRRGEFSRAVGLLTESARSRVTDAQLFLYLGLAQRELNKGSESTGSLQKALALGLKSAEAEQANKALASLSKPQQHAP